MAGRSRGRGSTTSLTQEQLQSMGVGRGEVQGPALGPPPLYPKLENRPLPLQVNASMDYMLIIKKQYMDFLHDSPTYVLPSVIKKDIERYSDKYKVLSAEGKFSKTPLFYWPHMPAELRPLHLKKRDGTKVSRKRKLAQPLDIETRLKKLEQKELKDNSEGIKEEIKEENNSSGDEEGRDSDKEEMEDQDEEMDDGTDYVDNYFDNGEAFDDDDENLDDGPVY